MKPEKDDWQLTLKELESQELQLTISMELNNAAKIRIKKMIKESGI